MFNMHWHMFIISTVTTSKFPSLTVIFFVITSAQIWGKSPCFNCAAVWDQGEQWAPHRHIHGHMVTASASGLETATLSANDCEVFAYLRITSVSSSSPDLRRSACCYPVPSRVCKYVYIMWFCVAPCLNVDTALWVFVCAETLAIANLSMECR